MNHIYSFIFFKKRMKTSQPFELSQLAHDLIGPVKSIEGLVNIAHYQNSKEEAEEICIWLQESSKKIDKRIAEALTNILEGKLKL